jgi:tetratricopeptide (TPR) repeat protein
MHLFILDRGDRLEQLAREIGEENTGIWSASVHAQQASGQKYYERGKLYYTQKNYEQAITDYERAWLLLRADFTYHQLEELGDAYRGARRFEDAYNAYGVCTNITEQTFLKQALWEKIIRCRLEGALFRSQQGEWHEARMNAQKALAEAEALAGTTIDPYHLVKQQVFREFYEANPQSVVALVLLVLAAEQNSDLDDLPLTMIKTEPGPVREIVGTWMGTKRAFGKARLLEAFAAYELGEHGMALGITTWSFHLPNWLGMERSEMMDEIYKASRDLSCRPPFLDHPVCELALGFYYRHTNNILAAIGYFDKAFGKFADHLQPYVEDTLKLAPQAIEQHLAKEEYEKAAELARRLNDPVRAGEWYKMAAERAEQKGDNDAAAKHFQSAAECFDKTGNQETAAACWQNVRRLRREAELQVEWATPDVLVVTEWDALDVTVANTGFGPAWNLKATVEGPMTVHDTGEMGEIAAGERKTVEIVVRPDNAGRRVPIGVQISYEDGAGAHVMPPITKLLNVKRLAELQQDQSEGKAVG